MSDYKRIVLPLDTPRDTPTELDGTRNRPIATVQAAQVPAGSVAALHFGPGTDPWPIANQGLQWKPCPMERGGLFVTNLAGGGEIVLMVTFGGGAVEVER